MSDSVELVLHPKRVIADVAQNLVRRVADEDDSAAAERLLRASTEFLRELKECFVELSRDQIIPKSEILIMLKVLFLAANPADTTKVRLDEEARDIEEKIRAAEHRDAVQFITKWAVRSDDLLQFLNQYHPQIVHFSGHGSANGEIKLLDNQGQTQLASQESLVELFRIFKSQVRLVLLNACHSSSQAKAITEAVDYAIGMDGEIQDQSAIFFAASFYRALGFGNSVQNAFDQGKVALSMQGRTDKKTPTLFVKNGESADAAVLVDALKA